MTAPPGPRVGRGIARVDASDWSVHPFLREPLNRAIDVRRDPTGEWLYVVDFDEFEMSDRGVEVAETGRVRGVRLADGEPTAGDSVAGVEAR